MNVDDFIWGNYGTHQYARFVFMLFRLPAANQLDFAEWIARYRLFCDWKGKRWRVTGASRMGDVWLASDFERDVGYDDRVDLEECSNWGAEP